MTTVLAKPVKRVVMTRRSGALVMTMRVEGLYVREKGRRKEYGPLDYGSLLLRAATEYVAAQKAEKKKLAAERRKARRAGL